MKLSSVNTRLDFNMDALMSKEVGFDGFIPPTKLMALYYFFFKLMLNWVFAGFRYFNNKTILCRTQYSHQIPRHKPFMVTSKIQHIAQWTL